jgi:hypothetical protein
MSRFGIAVNLKRLAPGQYRNFDFNSMCVFQGKPIAAGSDGIYSLEDAEKDNGTNIDSLVEFPTSDFGALVAKRFRKLYVGYETSGNLTLSWTVDDTTTGSTVLRANKTGQKQHRGIVAMSRAYKGVYWMFKVESAAGCDFSIDMIEGVPVIMTKGRR